MYNRYIHNDNGTYTRIQEEEPESSCSAAGQTPPVQEPQRPPQNHSGPADAPSSLLRRTLDQLHLDSIDAGDLLLLGLLWFLYREQADEELLFALGLLLIL